MRHSDDPCQSTRQPGNVRVVAPIALVCASVMMLVGCIYIPATRALQTNNKRRPESLVGKRDVIQIGVTTFADAIVAAYQQVQDDNHHQTSVGVAVIVPVSYESKRRLFISADGQCAALPYELRKGSAIWPLCGMAVPDAGERWFVIERDQNGLVRSTHTTDTFPDGFDAPSPGLMSTRITVAELARLRDAGVEFDDEFRIAQRKRQQETMDRMKRDWAERRSTTVPTTTQAIPSTQP